MKPALVLRFVWIAAVACWALVRYAARRIAAGLIDRNARDRLRGDELARLFTRLGATFVKFGQILSTRPDLLGPGYTTALARLQDRVPPGPFERVERTLVAELGPEWRSRIVELDEVPVAAASVAEVHLGKLDTGEEVAVKVQRPEAEAQVERDLVLLSLGARFVNALPGARPLSLPGAVARFSDAMRGQLDFTREAANNRRFAANFASHPKIGVPRLHDDLCTRRVLTMERIHGVRATEPELVGGDRAALARLGGETVLSMVFEHAFIHADLHPGNILLTDDGRVALIDLGLIAEIPDDMMKPWCFTFMALAQRNGEEVARLFYAYAPTVADIDYVAFEREVVELFEPTFGKPIGEIEASAMMTGAMAILRRYRVAVDPVYTVVNLAMVVAEGLGKQLDPDIDMVELAFPYLFDAIATAPDGKPPLREPPRRALPRSARAIADVVA